MASTLEAPTIALENMRNVIQDEDALVADEPGHGFHFPVGVLLEMARVLEPGGRLRIGDILVREAVPPSAKEGIALGAG